MINYILFNQCGNMVPDQQYLSGAACHLARLVFAALEVGERTLRTSGFLKGHIGESPHPVHTSVGFSVGLVAVEHAVVVNGEELSRSQENRGADAAAH
jgi:hypothetical protein